MSPPSVLPQGSTILVTGANGFVASHIVEQLLKQDAGYKVRGTARSTEKLEPLKKQWDEAFGAGRFEIAVVPDLLKEGALDEAMKDVSAVAHVASVVSFSPKYDEVVPPTVKFTLEAMKSAAKFPNIKRFVLTSSIAAEAESDPSGGSVIPEDSWNEEAKIKAKELPDDDPSKGMVVYCASKAEGEQAAWKFVEEQKPSFEFNAVLPAFVIGRILDEASQSGSTGGFSRDVFRGERSFAGNFTPQCFVSAEDTALIHVGALTLPDVTSKRINAAYTAFSWDEMQAVYRKLYASRKFNDFSGAKSGSSYDNKRGEAILKQMGRKGWQSFESALEDLVGRE